MRLGLNVRWRRVPLSIAYWLALATPTVAAPKVTAIAGGGPSDMLNLVSACPDGGVVAAGKTGVKWRTGGPVHCIGRCGGPTDVMVWRVSPVGKLLWCAVIGGSQTETLGGLVALPDGSTIVAGSTQSPDFPTSPGRGHHGGDDLFVMRIAPDGTTFRWSICVGGSGEDLMNGFLYDPAGAILVCGGTGSRQIAGMRAFGPGLPDGLGDGFVARIGLDGRQQYLTILGGHLNGDTCISMALAPGGDLVVGGFTWSPDLATTPGAFELGAVRVTDSFVTRLDRSGSPMWIGRVGGDNFDDLERVLVDSGGNAWLQVATTSYNLPVTPGAAQPRRRPGKSRERVGFECAVMELGGDGKRLRLCTYVSTPGDYDLELFSRHMMLLRDGGCMIAGTVRRSMPPGGEATGWPWRRGDQAMLVRRFDRFGRCRPSPPWSNGGPVYCVDLLAAPSGAPVAVVFTRTGAGLWPISTEGAPIGPIVPVAPGFRYGAATWTAGGSRLAIAGYLLGPPPPGATRLGPTNRPGAVLFLAPVPTLP